MEITPKKSRVAYESLFPSDEELAMLAETGQFDLLEERLKYKNAEYALKSAMERENSNDVVFDKDVLSVILIHLEAGQVLDMASKIPMVQKIIQQPNFWKRKLEHDMPELFVPYYEDQNIFSIFMTALDQEPELKTKYKNLYFVFRYIVWKVRKWTASDSLPNFARFKFVKRLPTFKIVFGFKRDSLLFDRQIVSKDGMTIRFSQVTWLEMIRQMDISPLFYLSIFMRAYKGPATMNMSRWSEKVFALAVMERAILLLTKKTTNKLENIRVHDNRSFIDLVRLGYAKKENGVPVIGQCVSCKLMPVTALAGCCKQIGYCSEECAREDWPKHECSRK